MLHHSRAHDGEWKAGSATEKEAVWELHQVQKRPETAAETTLPGNKATQGEFWHSLDSSQINAHRRPDPGLH